jgi:hypothetical protein
VYEWEKLMLIHTTDNNRVEVFSWCKWLYCFGRSNRKSNCNDETILLRLEDDMLITGSD